MARLLKAITKYTSNEKRNKIYDTAKTYFVNSQVQFL